MSVGFVMLAHTGLHRAAEVLHKLAEADCPVAVHVDKRVSSEEVDWLKGQVASLRDVSFAPRLRCDWGTWSLVEASRSAAEWLIDTYPEIDHVFLISGACLPIKSIDELKEMLAKNRGTDFIESVTIEEVPWTKGGLSEERFTLSFPFAWKRHRRLFDAYVEIQRRLGRRRKLPEGLRPHMGSQWWCLSRETIDHARSDARRAELDAYFKRVWIPDESYYQSLVRLYARKVESRSLTLSKFDFKGKPHVFYDDHLILLRQASDYFARKIWPGADRLYRAFLSDVPEGAVRTRPASKAHIDRTFAEAVRQRTRGRPGLVMAGRYPSEGYENGLTAQRYAVFQGFDETFDGFGSWLTEEIGGRVHGHLYAEARAEFVDGKSVFAGNLSGSATLRDYDPVGFLRSLIWNTRGEHQSFYLGPQDAQTVNEYIADDRNAHIFVISGAWAIPLFRSGETVGDLRAEAARLQSLETAFIERLQERRTRAVVRLWTLGEVLERPGDILNEVADGLHTMERTIAHPHPPLRRLRGLAAFLQDLRNAGMNPHLVGEVSDPPERPDLSVVASGGRS